MSYQAEMSCKIVANFYDGTAEVILAWPQCDAQHPQENLFTGSINLKLKQADAAAFVPGKSYTITVEEIAQIAAPVVTLFPAANSENSGDEPTPPDPAEPSAA